jgi:hypothetical protein
MVRIRHMDYTDDDVAVCTMTWLSDSLTCAKVRMIGGSDVASSRRDIWQVC